MNEQNIDFIGDTHGHATELEDLLTKLGYSKKENAWKHPDRIAFFVGDYIDRGPQIRKTLNIVRRMVDSGSAKAIMGNHEYNAICFNYKNVEGEYLREHSLKNVNQHSKTREQFQGLRKEYIEAIEWFRTLPLFYETDHFRAVHACWDHQNIQRLRKSSNGSILSKELLTKSVEKGTELADAFDQTLKGKELELPEGLTFHDEGGHERNMLRIKWWEKVNGHTIRSIAVKKSNDLPDLPINDKLPNHTYYGEDEKPVFFGHYWLNGNPSIYRHNICCLDYSVAKRGKLVAYRFDGEKRLTNGKLVFV